MNKHKKFLLFIFGFLVIVILNNHSALLHEKYQLEIDDKYDEGYYDRYNHKKPSSLDDPDYMEGYQDAYQYRY